MRDPGSPEAYSLDLTHFLLELLAVPVQHAGSYSPTRDRARAPAVGDLTPDQGASPCPYSGRSYSPTRERARAPAVGHRVCSSGLPSEPLGFDSCEFIHTLTVSKGALEAEC